MVGATESGTTAMTRVLSLQDDWRHVATVEVADAATGLAQLRDDAGQRSRLVPSEHAQAGSCRYDILVDFGIGAREAAHVARDALARLQQAADRGELPGYRIVNGRHWLELAAIIG